MIVFSAPKCDFVVTIKFSAQQARFFVYASVLAETPRIQRALGAVFCCWFIPLYYISEKRLS